MKINEIYLSQSPIIERNDENLSNNSFISYKIALSPFISIKPLMREFYGGFPELSNDLVNYQILFDEFRKRIVELKMNLKYYKIITGKCPLEESEISTLREICGFTAVAWPNCGEPLYITADNSYKCMKCGE